MARKGIVGLAQWVFANADRVLRLLQGLTERLPEIGGTMEKAGAALVSAGAALGGKDGAGGARAEVERIRDLLERYEAALDEAAADLRSASASLGAIKIPSLSTGERNVQLPARLGSINIPSVIFSDQTPLQGVADIITRQIAHLEGAGAAPSRRARRHRQPGRDAGRHRGGAGRRRPPAADQRERAEGAGGVREVRRYESTRVRRYEGTRVRKYGDEADGPGAGCGTVLLLANLIGIPGCGRAGA